MKNISKRTALRAGLCLNCLIFSLSHSAPTDPAPPAETVKLVFIHHSCGENWLANWDGGLGLALRDNNYFVSDVNYGWGPDGIGDNTDIGHWWSWFCGPSSSTYLAALYTDFGDHSYNYTRLSDPDQARENQIVMFKSCFPNSHLGGSPGDAPTTGSNPLRGQPAYRDDIGGPNPDHTVAHAKGVYNDLLGYFATRQDKLFIVITAPPLGQNDTDAVHAANARALNNWLVNDWLDGYAHANVTVFDFNNVLTSNGGSATTNDIGWTSGNHHRWWVAAVQHSQTVSNDFSAYCSGPWDSHPTAAGNQKGTAEFVTLLNVYYNSWKTATGTGQENGPSIPTEYVLQQNYPNPFNSSTTISYTLPRIGTVSLKIYDILGREVETIVDTVQKPGSYRIEWDGGLLPSGTYLCRLHCGDFTQVKKLLLLR